MKRGDNMARPKKFRRVAQFPKENYFVPYGVPRCQLEETNISVEELEAMRLKDVESLSQEECAELMGVSRQTFQLIIESGRAKLTSALLEGKAISIKGGHYTTEQCKFVCLECGHSYEIDFKQDHQMCPKCGSVQVRCQKKAQFCQKWCQMDL